MMVGRPPLHIALASPVVPIHLSVALYHATAVFLIVECPVSETFIPDSYLLLSFPPSAVFAAFPDIFQDCS